MLQTRTCDSRLYPEWPKTRMSMIEVESDRKKNCSEYNAMAMVLGGDELVCLKLKSKKLRGKGGI